MQYKFVSGIEKHISASTNRNKQNTQHVLINFSKGGKKDWKICFGKYHLIYLTELSSWYHIRKINHIWFTHIILTYSFFSNQKQRGKTKYAQSQFKKKKKVSKSHIGLTIDIAKDLFWITLLLYSKKNDCKANISRKV